MFVDYRKVPDVDMYIGMHAIDVYTREPAQEQSFTQHLAYTLNLKLPPNLKPTQVFTGTPNLKPTQLFTGLVATYGVSLRQWVQSLSRSFGFRALEH